MKGIGIVVKLFADNDTEQRLTSGNGDEPLTISDLGVVVRGHFRQFTLYNLPALAAAVVFTATLFHPWWYASAYHDRYLIEAYAFTLTHNLPPYAMTFVIETPRAAVALLICLLAGYLLLAFWGSTLAGMKGRLMVAFTGCCMLLYTAGFYGALWYAMNRIDLPVTGYHWFFHEVQVDIYMYFLQHYHIAIGAGAACLLSAAVHDLLPVRFYRKKESGRR